MDVGRSGASAGAEDDERWAQALSVLERQPTERAGERLRRFRRTVVWRIAGLGLAAVAVGVLVAALTLGSGGDGASADPAAWQEVTGLVLLAVGLVVEVAGFVVMRRAGLLRKDRWAVPAAVLTKTQRALLRDQVRGRAPVDPTRLPLARDGARRIVAQRGQVVLVVGVLFLLVGQAVSDPGLWRAVLAGAFVVFYAVVVWALERDARRAERFLAAHPAPVGAG